MSTTKKRPTEFPTEKELKLILSKVDKRSNVGIRDYAILMMLSNCGMRKSELIDLKKKSLYIDKENGSYIYFKTLKKRKKRNSSNNNEK